ncbi:MAG: hypothetical protein PVF05_13095 [Gemmatimonadales bacterium]|jgi:hypothetical protein
MRRHRQILPAPPRAAVLLLAGTLSLSVVACERGEDPEIAARRTALEQQRSQLVDQFAVAQNQVRATQAQAMDDPSIDSLRSRFYDLLRARMIEIEPRAGAWLDRAQVLGARIDELSKPLLLEEGQAPPADDDRDSVMSEFATLEKTLQPLQNRALQDPEVAAAFGEMQDSVHALMVRMNPDAAPALERMKRTSAAVDSIDAELADLGRPEE